MNSQTKPYCNPSTHTQINLDISWKFDKHSIYFCHKQTKKKKKKIEEPLTLTATCNINLHMTSTKEIDKRKLKDNQLICI